MSAKVKTFVLLAALVAALAAVVGGGGTAAAAGSECPNEEFRTGLSAVLPECRAYEMVSPPDKNNATLQYLTNAGAGEGFASPDGQHFVFTTTPPFGDAASGFKGFFVSDRTEAGWKTVNRVPANCTEEAIQEANALSRVGYARDLSTLVLRAPAVQKCAPGDEAGMDLYARRLGGPLEWVSQNGSPKTENVNAGYAGASADASHIVFYTPQRLVLPLEEGRVAGNGLYERIGDDLRSVGLDSNGGLINPCGATIAGGQGQAGPVSTNGRVIFFTSGQNSSIAGCSPATDDGGQLYARIDGSRTVEISSSVREVADPGGRKPPAFLGATAEGSMVFFRSAEALTEDAPSGGGLYVYDLAGVLDGGLNAGQLSFIAPIEGSGSQFAFLGMSEDGQRAYFYDTGAYGPGAVEGAENLYLSDHGDLRFVSEVTDISPGVMNATVSPDGTKLVYLSGDGFGNRGAFLYDAVGGGPPDCISCMVGPGTETGDTLLYGPASLYHGRPDAVAPNRYVTNGGTAFFTTKSRLSDRDINGVYDVYGYRSGERFLISSGTDDVESLLMGVEADARDVFFATYQSLLPRDIDNGDQDIYDARVNGGFAASAASSPCSGQECLPPATRTPPSSPVATKSLHGTGNTTADQTPHASVPRKVIGHGAKFVVGVKTTGPGRFVAWGHGVGKTKKAVAGAQTSRLVLHLKRWARMRVALDGSAILTVAVKFVPKGAASSTATTSVTVLRGHRSHRGSSSRQRHVVAPTEGR